MSCDYCQRTGEQAAATGGLGRTFSRARWSAGRTDVRAWFEERRRQQGLKPPFVQAALVVEPGSTVHFDCQPSQFEVPHYADEAAPLINAALDRVLGRADFVATSRPLSSSAQSSRENVVNLAHHSGLGQPAAKVWHPVCHCLAFDKSLVHGSVSALLLHPVTDGRIPTITACTGAVLATAAGRDLLRAVDGSPEVALYRLSPDGQAALFTVRLFAGNLADGAPALHATRLRLWPGDAASYVWGFGLDAQGTLVKTTELCADPAQARRLVEMEQDPTGCCQQCCACGYLLLPNGTCPRCRTPRSSRVLASRVRGPSAHRRP